MMITAVDLRIEYLVRPLGMDEASPRFSWKIAGAERQKTWRIRVRSEDGVFWDSGEVAGAESSQVVYGGRKLEARRHYRWQVRLTDGEGKPGEWSAEESFETGLMDEAWEARWISGGVPESLLAPPVNFRREFSLGFHPARARLYLTALGVYRPWCNGVRVTENTLMPGFTAYQSRVQYQAYDVTDLLVRGDNALAVEVAEGWYKGMINRHWNNRRTVWGDRVGLLARLEVEGENGERFTLLSDSDWRWSDCGPYRMSDIYDGEIYDARLECPGWKLPGFDHAGWVPAECFEPDPEMKVVWNSGEPVRAIEELAPLSVTEQAPGVWIVDLGQNVSGRERLKIAAPRDAKITVRHGEMLKEDGSLYTENLREAKATTVYYSDGAERVYEPEFTWYGFRYLEITGWPLRLQPGDVRVEVLHTAMRRTGWFECSSGLLNQLYRNIVWGQRDNYLDIPTDCPQRDERMGWTGDAQVFIGTAAYNYDIAAFFTKWLDDVDASCSPSGSFPPVAPLYRNAFGFNQSADPGWGDAGIICPWTVYLFYGDRRILERHYPAMVRHVQSMRDDSPTLIRSKESFCDWLNMDAPTSKELVCTAYFAYSVKLLARIARIIGREEDADSYAALFERIRQAYIGEFFTPAGELTQQTQTAALLTLEFGLAPEEFIAKTVEMLVRDIRVNRGTHLSTGFLGTPCLTRVLTRYGHGDLAYQLVNQTTFPSWLYSVTQGATTVWERWNSWTREDGFGDVTMNSFNHYAYGAVAGWFYDTIAGIRPDEANPGFRHFFLEPMPGGGLEYAGARFDAPAGVIRSEWRSNERGSVDYEFEVPPNTGATLKLPDGSVHELAPGIHKFTC